MGRALVCIALIINFSAFDFSRNGHNKLYIKSYHFIRMQCYCYKFKICIKTGEYSACFHVKLVITMKISRIPLFVGLKLLSLSFFYGIKKKLHGY